MGSWITRTNRAKFSESREESCYPWGIREERRGIDSMTKAIRAGLGGAWIAAALCFATLSIAQQNIPAVEQNSRAYNVSRKPFWRARSFVTLPVPLVSHLART